MAFVGTRRVLLNGGGGVDPIFAAFANGEAGWVRIPLPYYSTLYQERTGASATTPASANNDPIGTFHDLVTNTYWTASADSRRPLLSIASGYYGAAYDGLDDCLLRTGVNLTASNKLTLIHGVKTNNSGAGVITEFSATANTNNGAFALITRNVVNGDLGWSLRGNVGVVARTSGGASLPRTADLYCAYDLAQPTTSTKVQPEIDGSVPSLTNAGAPDAGGGTFGNYTAYSGARADASLRFLGTIYAEIAIGRLLTADEKTAIMARIAALTP